MAAASSLAIATSLSVSGAGAFYSGSSKATSDYSEKFEGAGANAVAAQNVSSQLSLVSDGPLISNPSLYQTATLASSRYWKILDRPIEKQGIPVWDIITAVSSNPTDNIIAVSKILQIHYQDSYQNQTIEDTGLLPPILPPPKNLTHPISYTNCGALPDPNQSCFKNSPEFTIQSAMLEDSSPDTRKYLLSVPNTNINSYNEAFVALSAKGPLNKFIFDSTFCQFPNQQGINGTRIFLHTLKPGIVALAPTKNTPAQGDVPQFINFSSQLNTFPYSQKWDIVPVLNRPNIFTIRTVIPNGNNPVQLCLTLNNFSTDKWTLIMSLCVNMFSQYFIINPA
jgi:hypothetical protein